MHKYTDMCMCAGTHTGHSSVNFSANIIFKIKGISILTIIKIKNLIKKN